MAHFDVPVSEYMTAPVHGVSPDTELPMVQHKLAELGLSSLAVIDGASIVGVISRTDLLEVGRRETGDRGRSALLELPARAVSELMSSGPLTIRPDDPLSAAAALMRERSVHRVFAVEGSRLVGVLSTLDVMRAVRDKQANSPLTDVMSSPVFTVRAAEPIALATERIGNARISGLVVVDDDWPVGLFTQVEALECRDLSRDTPVDEVMNPGMICLPESTKIWRAAQQAIAMRARRIIAVKNREMSGIVGGLDFARYAARQRRVSLG